MINKILGTAGTRVLNAIFNTVILIVLTRELGSAGFGIISLIILAITILQLLIDLVAGSGIIYFTTRKPIIQLLVPAYIWILMVLMLYLMITLIAPGFFPNSYYWIVPKDFEFHILFLTLLNALMLTHYNLLIGLTRIKTYNTIFVIQSSILIVSVLVMYFILDKKSVLSFVYSMYFAYGTGTVLSLISVAGHLKRGSLKGWFTTAKAVIGYGFTSQLANVLHIGNKRFSFYILKYFSGVSAVGIYSAGAQLTEGLRLIGQSISLVQFSTIASQDRQEYSRQLTIRLMKLSLTVTLFALILLLVVPSSFYTLIFKKDFSDLKLIIAGLSPGVLALAANTIFSGYFSGVGQPKISLIVNAIGMVVTLISAWLLIPLLGYTGAALAASLSYTSSVVGQHLIFQHQTGTKFHEWIPDKSDYLFFVSMVRKFTKKN
ncbi:MAG: polysaccharide biosynthesis C-terminal domain-containing protein [Bacteroidales bacterium]|jgi:O-antigen/teichoic acid export membrane protein